MAASTLADPTSGNTQKQEYCLLAQIFMTFYEDQIHLRVSFSFISEPKSIKTCTYLFPKIIKIIVPSGRTHMTMRVNELEHSPSKRWPSSHRGQQRVNEPILNST